MEGSPFRVRGIDIAECRGRASTLQRVRGELVNNQVSIVGPRHGGKTVLIHRLGETLDEGERQFSGCLSWNLKEGRFPDDTAFLAEFRRRLLDPVMTLDNGLVEYLQAEDLSALESIQAVFEGLQSTGKCLAVCLDGFDALPIGTALSAALLENLRAIAVRYTRSIRYVVASRKPLRDLCPSLETANSPFHNLFPEPIVLKALTRQEIDDFIIPFREAGIEVNRGVDAELLNWSGGFPLLLSMLAQKLWTRLMPGSALTPEIVNEEGASLISDSSGYLQDLWDDCTPEQKELMANLASGQVPDVTPASRRYVRPLVDRGYLSLTGNRVQFQCRTMKAIAEGELGAQSELMASLFGTADRFSQNVRVLIQYRLSNRVQIDEHLVRVTEKIIDSFDDPNTAIALFREAARHLFSLVWNRLLPDRRVPAAWADHWRSLQERNIRVTPFNTVPGDGSQCKLLDQITGQHRPVDTCIRRSTYLLLNSLWSVGDYGQHREAEDVAVGFLACACLTLLEAWAQLEGDLRRP